MRIITVQYALISRDSIDVIMTGLGAGQPRNANLSKIKEYEFCNIAGCLQISRVTLVMLMLYLSEAT